MNTKITENQNWFNFFLMEVKNKLMKTKWAKILIIKSAKEIWFILNRCCVSVGL